MKIRKGLVGMLGGLAVACGMSGEAKCGEITLNNYTSTPNINKNNLYLRNMPGATEGYNGQDGTFLSSPPNALEGYSMVEGHKLDIDSRPIKTKGWDFLLGVEGSVTGNNTLWYKISDMTYLADPYQIKVYDVLHPEPENKTTLIKDSAWHNITLSSLVSESHNPYAHWRADVDVIVGNPESYTLDNVIASNVDVKGDLTANSIVADTLTIGFVPVPGSSIPEPGTLELLAMAGLAGYGLATMRKGKKEE